MESERGFEGERFTSAWMKRSWLRHAPAQLSCPAPPRHPWPADQRREGQPHAHLPEPRAPPRRRTGALPLLLVTAVDCWRPAAHSRAVAPRTAHAAMPADTPPFAAPLWPAVQLRRWMAAAGMRTWADQVANVHGRVEGAGAGAGGPGRRADAAIRAASRWTQRSIQHQSCPCGAPLAPPALGTGHAALLCPLAPPVQTWAPRSCGWARTTTPCTTAASLMEPWASWPASAQSRRCCWRWVQLRGRVWAGGWASGCAAAGLRERPAWACLLPSTRPARCRPQLSNRCPPHPVGGPDARPGVAHRPGSSPGQGGGGQRWRSGAGRQRGAGRVPGPV